jgi:hypothetical protein
MTTTEELPLTAQVDLWRQQAIAGTLTTEQLRDAIRVLRQGRQTAVANSPRAKTAGEKAAAEKAAADILGGLDE